MRRARKGEQVCHCHAYGFPHRFGSGRCHGASLVEEQWEATYGTGLCAECNALAVVDGISCCQVIEGQEKVVVCPAWQDFVLSNEVRLLGEYWRNLRV